MADMHCLKKPSGSRRGLAISENALIIGKISILPVREGISNF
jgi:hypothetical protein